MALPDDGEPYEIGWDRPTTFPARLRPVAEAELANLNAELAPASDATVRSWLAKLAVLVAGGRSTASDAEVKLNAYAVMMGGRTPVCAFTRETLDRAARKFKFLPSYAELTELLSSIVLPKASRANRLAHALTLPPPEPPRAPPTAEEIARVEAIVSGARRGVAMHLGRDAPDYDVEAAAKRYTDAMSRWHDDGRQGPAPKPEDFGMKARAA